MYKKILGGIVVFVIIAVAAVNVNLNISNSHFSISLSDIESLSAESCTNSPSNNTGTCRGNVGSSGVSCVTPSSGQSIDCNGVTG
jgi:hypothetical protein